MYVHKNLFYKNIPDSAWNAGKLRTAWHIFACVRKNINDGTEYKFITEMSNVADNSG